MLPERKREIPMGEAGNLSVYFLHHFNQFSLQMLAGTYRGRRWAPLLWDPQELYMLFTFTFSENYGIVALYTAEWNCADSETWSTKKTRLSWFKILRPVTDGNRHFIRIFLNSVLNGWAIWPKSYITLWVILFHYNVMIYITILCFMISN